MAALEAQQEAAEQQRRALEAALGELGTSRSRISLIEQELQVGAAGGRGAGGSGSQRGLASTWCVGAAACRAALLSAAGPLLC